MAIDGVEVRATDLDRCDVLIDGLTPAVVVAVEAVEGRPDLVLVRVRNLDSEGGCAEYEFFDDRGHRRLIAAGRFAG
ncbi:hypothetical protein [Gordonia otitidis]|uniref:Uncharacterized protein n=1 Tax=Gordonia otitidis (strain DSM 44809 / CCUG 52243 / JCM 12355 / NBRC 100426 / IFM 10032) TaxID=1108044 RepID=H5TSC6_GORO1|nr:hypothetical protein [Gordonia otitidis]GAB36384.1 hypothetical protein GOOTI_214_00100 [Gordonia otitidis NBRC 100426]